MNKDPLFPDVSVFIPTGIFLVSKSKVLSFLISIGHPPEQIQGGAV